MTNSFLPYAKHSITAEEAAEISDILTADMITRGPNVEQFEQAIAEFCGASYGVAYNSGTTALQAACYAAKVSKFDRVITSPNSFIATVGGALHYQASPVFVDIDPVTANLDLGQVQAALQQRSSRGRSIVIPVHFAGVPVDMMKLNQQLLDPDAVIIEDAAHALGSYYPDGKKVGCCHSSQMTVFSFHPAKTITTGEGGMVMTNDQELLYRLRLFRNNGIERRSESIDGEQGPWIYDVKDITGNFNFTEFQAALGLSQLRKLERMVQKRQLLLSWYQERLGRLGSDLSLLTPQVDRRVAYQICVMRINFAACRTDRKTVMEKLKEEGIGTHVHYIPLYRYSYFRRMCGDLIPYFPHMEKYYAETLSLPFYPDLQEEEVDRVCAVLRKILGR